MDAFEDGAAGNDQLDGDTGSDIVVGGAGADVFVLQAGDGGAFLGQADLFRDYTDGTDQLGLRGGLVFGDLTIAADAGGAIVSRTATGEVLAQLLNVNAASLNAADFVAVS